MAVLRAATFSDLFQFARKPVAISAEPSAGSPREISGTACPTGQPGLAAIKRNRPGHGNEGTDHGPVGVTGSECREKG